MKGLSGAEFLPCDTHGEPLHDDDGRPLTTLPELPDELPGITPAWEALTELPRVRVAGNAYFALGVPIGTGDESRGTLYVFYPESLWRDAVWEAIRPSLYVGIIGGLASLVLTALKQTKGTAAIEARSMILGAVALLIYASVVSYIVLRFRLPALWVSLPSLLLWMAAAAALWSLVLS